MMARCQKYIRIIVRQYILFREPTTAVNLQGYRIDSGTITVLSPWVVQRDDQFWDDPKRFRPKRWLDPQPATEGPPEYAYFPYGGGPRRCLGAGMANQILKLTLAVVCQRRQLQSVESLSVSAGPTLSVREGLKLRSYREESTQRRE